MVCPTAKVFGKLVKLPYPALLSELAREAPPAPLNPLPIPAIPATAVIGPSKNPPANPPNPPPPANPPNAVNPIIDKGIADFLKKVPIVGEVGPPPVFGGFSKAYFNKFGLALSINFSLILSGIANSPFGPSAFTSNPPSVNTPT